MKIIRTNLQISSALRASKTCGGVENGRPWLVETGLGEVVGSILVPARLPALVSLQSTKTQFYDGGNRRGFQQAQFAVLKKNVNWVPRRFSRAAGAFRCTSKTAAPGFRVISVVDCAFRLWKGWDSSEEKRFCWSRELCFRKKSLRPRDMALRRRIATNAATC